MRRGCTYSWLTRDSADRLGGCRQPEVLGGHCRGLVLNRNDGSVRCGRLQAFSGRGPPHRWEQTHWWGSEPLAISCAPESTPTTRPGQFYKRLDPAGRVLVPHHSRPRRSPRDGGAVSGWSLSRWWELEDHSQVRQPAEENTLVKQGSALLPMAPAPPPAPGHQGTAESIKALLSSTMVGATGFEPVTSSVSAKHREPLCSAPFSQVAFDRRWQS